MIPHGSCSSNSENGRQRPTFSRSWAAILRFTFEEHIIANTYPSLFIFPSFGDSANQHKSPMVMDFHRYRLFSPIQIVASRNLLSSYMKRKRSTSSAQQNQNKETVFQSLVLHFDRISANSATDYSIVPLHFGITQYCCWILTIRSPFACSILHPLDSLSHAVSVVSALCPTDSHN